MTDRDTILRAAQPRENPYFGEVNCETLKARNLVVDKVFGKEANFRKIDTRDVESVGNFTVVNMNVEERKSNMVIVRDLVIKKTLGVYYSDIVNNVIKKRIPVRAGDYLDIDGVLCFIFRVDHEIHIEPKLPNLINQRIEHIKHIILNYDNIEKLLNTQ